MNITSSGIQKLRWLIWQTTYHVIAIQEHKLRKDKYFKTCAKLSKYYHVVGTQARIKITGPSGGVMLLARKGLAILRPKGLYPGPGRHDLWCHMVLWVEKQSYAFLTAYLFPDDMGANYETLHHVEKWIGSIQCPYLFMAAWNRSHMDNVNALFGPALTGDYIVPRNTDVTCTQGRGSLIDYGYVSKHMIHYIENVEADYEVPIKTHKAIAYTISAKPQQVMVQALVQPRKLVMIDDPDYPGWDQEKCAQFADRHIQSNKQRAPLPNTNEYCQKLNILEPAKDMAEK